MQSILEEFAYGNISPQAQSVKKNSKYGQAMEMVAKNQEKLIKMLVGEEKKVFEAYADMWDEAHALAAVSNLIYGFKLGLTMTAEAFVTRGDLVAGGEENLT